MGIEPFERAERALALERAIYEGVVAPDAASARLPAYYRKVKPVRGRFEYSGDD